MHTPTPLDEIREKAATAMRGYLSDGKNARTLRAKQIAEALVEARAHFETRDGTPDYLGRSYAYRTWVSDTLEAAGVPKGDRASLQSIVRYHVSPLLRERYGAEVTKLGLEEGDLKERQRRARERDARIVSIFSGGGELTEVEDALLVANLSRLAVNRVSGVPKSDKSGAAQVRDAFENLEKAVGAARDRLG